MDIFFFITSNSRGAEGIKGLNLVRCGLSIMFGLSDDILPRMSHFSIDRSILSIHLLVIDLELMIDQAGPSPLLPVII